MCLNVSARWTVKTYKFTLLMIYCNFLDWLSTTKCILNINKQNVNIADETLTDYSFLSKYHYTKSKNYFKTRYQIRHWISMFIGTPCILFFLSSNVQFIIMLIFVQYRKRFLIKRKKSFHDSLRRSKTDIWRKTRERQSAMSNKISPSQAPISTFLVVR